MTEPRPIGPIWVHSQHACSGCGRENQALCQMSDGTQLCVSCQYAPGETNERYKIWICPKCGWQPDFSTRWTDHCACDGNEAGGWRAYKLVEVPVAIASDREADRLRRALEDVLSIRYMSSTVDMGRALDRAEEVLGR